MAVGIIGIINFISDTPHDNRRMIPIPQDHGGEILLVPFREILKISLMPGRIYIVARRPFIFRIFPLIKCFIHNQKAHFIAKLIKLRHVRVMAGTDRITAHFLQCRQASFPDLPGHGGSQAASVMMYADPFYFSVFPIQEKAFVCIETEGADSCFF